MPTDAKHVVDHCWHATADKRISFGKIVKVFKKLCNGFDISGLQQFR